MQAMAIETVSQLNEAARQAWVRAIGSDRIAAALAAAPRLRQRVVVSALAANHLGALPAPVDEARLFEAHAYLRQPERVRRLCGMTLHAPLLRRQTGRREFAALAAMFPLPDLQLVCRMPDLDGLRFAGEGELARLSQAVEAAGAECIARWIGSLPERLREEMLLCVAPPPETRLGFDLPAGAAAAIVRRIAAELATGPLG